MSCCGVAEPLRATVETEGVKLNFTDDAIAALASLAARVNENNENIGARRLHTILEKVLEEISFEGPDLKKKNVKIDGDYVRKALTDIVQDQDLSRYIHASTCALSRCFWE